MEQEGLDLFLQWVPLSFHGNEDSCRFYLMCINHPLCADFCIHVLSNPAHFQAMGVKINMVAAILMHWCRRYNINEPPIQVITAVVQLIKAMILNQDPIYQSCTSFLEDGLSTLLVCYNLSDEQRMALFELHRNVRMEAMCLIACDDLWSVKAGIEWMSHLIHLGEKGDEAIELVAPILGGLDEQFVKVFAPNTWQNPEIAQIQKSACNVLSKIVSKEMWRNMLLGSGLPGIIHEILSIPVKFMESQILLEDETLKEIVYIGLKMVCLMLEGCKLWDKERFNRDAWNGLRNIFGETVLKCSWALLSVLRTDMHIFHKSGHAIYLMKLHEFVQPGMKPEFLQPLLVVIFGLMTLSDDDMTDLDDNPEVFYENAYDPYTPRHRTTGGKMLTACLKPTRNEETGTMMVCMNPHDLQCFIASNTGLPLETIFYALSQLKELCSTEQYGSDDLKAAVIEMISGLLPKAQTPIDVLSGLLTFSMYSEWIDPIPAVIMNSIAEVLGHGHENNAILTIICTILDNLMAYKRVIPHREMLLYIDTNGHRVYNGSVVSLLDAVSKCPEVTMPSLIPRVVAQMVALLDRAYQEVDDIWWTLCMSLESQLEREAAVYPADDIIQILAKIMDAGNELDWNEAFGDEGIFPIVTIGLERGDHAFAAAVMATILSKINLSYASWMADFTIPVVTCITRHPDAVATPEIMSGLLNMCWGFLNLFCHGPAPINVDRKIMWTVGRGSAPLLFPIETHMEAEDGVGILKIISALVQAGLLPPDQCPGIYQVSLGLYTYDSRIPELVYAAASELIVSLVLTYDDIVMPDEALQIWIELIKRGFFATNYLRKLCILGLTKIATMNPAVAQIVQPLCAALTRNAIPASDMTHITDYMNTNSRTTMPIELRSPEIPGFVVNEDD